jgi:hypothetical protein
MPPSTPASTSRAVFSWRERTTRYATVFASSSRASTVTTVLLQSERERVDTREELLHVREDLRRLTASQNKLKDKLHSKDDMLTVRAHLLDCERIKVEKLEKNRAENVANLAWLTRTPVYLRDKAERLRRTLEDADTPRGRAH